MSKIQGDISSFPLSDLVQNLVANKKTGLLAIRHDGSERYIQFCHGKIVSYADTLGFSFAQWLVDKEIVPPERMAEALRRYRRTKRKTLGEILAGAGALDLEDYRKYLTDLIKETLYEVFSFTSGSFSFDEGEPAERFTDREARGLGIEVSATAAVMEAARRMDDWTLIRRHMPSENEIYVVLPAERERLLAEAEAEGDDVAVEALHLLDGRRTLRQVIATLPYSRFDACGALARLIAEKKIRPLDGSQVVHRAGVERDPEQEIACLRTILEREPSNRKVLGRLADLLEAQGERDESATCNKLVAISYLEDSRPQQAEAFLRKALALNPKDITTWRKLWDIIIRSGDTGRLREFGQEYVGHFRELGLLEVARDQLLELVRLFPEDLGFRTDLAEVRFALGEHKAASQSLFDLARDLLRRERFPEAEATLSRLLGYDKDHSKARELYEEVRSGRLAARRAFRRRLVRQGALTALFLALCADLAYEVHVRDELFQLTRSVLAESLLERGEYAEASSRIREFQRRHPLSFGARHDGRLLLAVLEEKSAARETETQDRPASGVGGTETGEGGGETPSRAGGPVPWRPAPADGAPRR